MSGETHLNGELQYLPTPTLTSGAVRTLELRPRLLPAMPPASALAAAGGAIAGAAVLATLRAARSHRQVRRGRRKARGETQARRVVASRSFLVDVHVLGR